MRILVTAVILINSAITGIVAQGHFKARDTHSKEIIAFAGMAYYIGDLNQTGHFKYQDIAGGLGFRYNLNARFALRATAFIGKVHASDEKSTSFVQRQRNLSFESWIQEVTAQAEFNFLPFQIGTADMFSPYIFLGMGGFHFNPKVIIGSDKYELRALSTEGQGTAAKPGSKRYLLTGVTVPFGLGFRWSLGKHIGLGVEWGIRKTFTDYIDDVSTTYPDVTALNDPIAITLSDRTLNKDPNISNIGRQRGDSKSTDWYSFTGVILSITLPEKDPGCRGVSK